MLVRLWNSSGCWRARFVVGLGHGGSPGFDPTGRLIVATFDGDPHVSVIDPVRGVVLSRPEVVSLGVATGAVEDATRTRCVGTGADGRTVLVDLAEGRVVTGLSSPVGAEALAVATDGSVVADDGPVTTPDETDQAVSDPSEGALDSLNLILDEFGRVVTRTTAGVAARVDLQTGRAVSVTRVVSVTRHDLSLDGSGARLVWHGDEGAGAGAGLFDASTGRLIGALGAPITGAVFSRDGERLLTFGDDHVGRIWNAHDARHLATLEKVLPVDACFDPTGRFLAICEGDSGPSIWEVSTGRRILALPWTGSEWPGSVAWSPDGRTLALVTGDEDGAVALWDIGTDDRPVAFVRADLSELLRTLALAPPLSR